MKKLFIKQFEFENWSNTLNLNSLKVLKEKDDRALILFSHLLSSHSMWLSRVTKTDIKCSLFQERTLEECEELMQQNYTAWLQFIEAKTEAELDEKIEFMSAWEKNPSKRSMSVVDAIIHLINHSSYHRGQIVVSIKNKSDELPLSTYIMFASEKI